MKLVFSFFLLFLFLVSSTFCQDSLDNNAERKNKHEYKNIVVGYSGGAGVIIPFVYSRQDLFLQYRFNNLRHNIGISFSNGADMNTKTVEKSTLDVNGNNVYYQEESRFSMNTIDAVYFYYLKDPRLKKFNMKVGTNVGVCFQYESITDKFSDPKDNNSITIGGTSFSASGNFTMEYSFSWIILFLETKVGYTFINREIDIYKNRNKLFSTLQFGVAFDLWRK